MSAKVESKPDVKPAAKSDKAPTNDTDSEKKKKIIVGIVIAIIIVFIIYTNKDKVAGFISKKDGDGDDGDFDIKGEIEGLKKVQHSILGSA
jgi:hypothetical protein